MANVYAVTTLSTTDATTTTDANASLTSRGGASIAKSAYIGGTMNYASIGTVAPATILNAASLTLSATDGLYMIEVAFAGTVSITLPLASTCPGKQYFIVKTSSNSFTLTISAAGSDKIDITDTSITSLLNAGDRVRLISNGSPAGGIACWYSA